jgi:hypothetical protein
VKWFGKDWGAPVCRETPHGDTPVGQECQRCYKQIKEGDQGIALDLNQYVWHLDCFIKSVCPLDR